VGGKSFQQRKLFVADLRVTARARAEHRRGARKKTGENTSHAQKHVIHKDFCDARDLRSSFSSRLRRAIPISVRCAESFTSRVAARASWLRRFAVLFVVL
jgi:hypothetical protein